ncbi:MAG: pitrilysin family protein [Mucilaginibacter sp.]|uniref:M16 family metallopeptidase n=1 Tax=Mucilaginibacter sp. TaxID=1882438 RepID=UPI0032674F4F
MKKILLTTIVLFAVLTSIQAQSETTSFDVGGIKVIFKPTQKNVINIRVYFRGGVTNYSSDKAGIEDLALEATTQCGTQKYSANAFRDTCEKYGVLMYGNSSYDYGYIQVNCISKYFNKSWDLFTQALFSPTFNAADVSLLKTKAIATIRRYDTNPENRLTKLEMRNAFATTPYKTDPGGTEETVNAFTADDLKNYYQGLLNKQRMFIVVVGNLTKQELYERILKSFDHIKSEPYTTPELITPDFNDNKLMVDRRDLKINYVGAIMNAPDFSSHDFMPYRLAIAGLSGNLYSHIRSSQGLSSDPSAMTYLNKMPYTVMDASTNDPQRVMMIMMNTLKSIQRTGYQEEWLQHIKNSYIIGNYINGQSASQITNSLGLAEILGNWHYADDLPQLVNMVTVEQMNYVINRYIIGMRWNYVGNVSAIEGFVVPKF